MPPTTTIPSSSIITTLAFVTLEANGATIEGEPTVATVAGEDVATRHDVLRFHHEVTRSQGHGIGGAHATSSKAEYGAVEFSIRWSSGLPELLEAFVENRLMAATFDFFRPSADSGEMEKLATVSVAEGRVVRLAYDLDPTPGSVALVAHVGLAIGQLTFSVHTPSSTEAEIDATSLHTS